MIELNPNAPGTVGLPPDVNVDVTDDSDFLCVSISLLNRWTVSVSQPLNDPDEPFMSEDVRRLCFAATLAAAHLLRDTI
jgi:hypothetical protein